jgi:hypothetical protein
MGLNYVSALTAYSPMYCRTSVCPTPNFYYEALKINVPISGYYSISSNSNMDIYGYLYNNSFNPLFPPQNLLTANDDGAGNLQFQLTYHLQSTVVYIVVATTYSKNVTGNFSINATGPASLNIFQINATSKNFKICK